MDEKRDGKTRIVENTWVCSSCKKLNLGRHMKCQTCGSTKEVDEEDVVPSPEDAATVTDASLLSLANQDSNWVCEHCGSQVRDEFGKCRNCSGPRAQIRETNTGMWSDPGWKGLREASERIRAEKETRRDERESKNQLLRNRVAVIVAVIGFSFLPLMALGRYFFGQRDIDTTVSKASWKYTSILHQKTLMHKSGWGAPNESSAFNSVCDSKYYGDEDCHPHPCRPHLETYSCNCQNYECGCHETCTSKKNGFSSCTTHCSTCSKCSTCSRTVYSTCYDRCPVFRNWCEYDYYDWPVINQVEVVGDTPDTKWSTMEPEGLDQRMDRLESYTVTFKSSDDAWDYKPKDLEEFKKFRAGMRWQLKVRRASSDPVPVKELK